MEEQKINLNNVVMEIIENAIDLKTLLLRANSQIAALRKDNQELISKTNNLQKQISESNKVVES